MGGWWNTPSANCMSIVMQRRSSLHPLLLARAKFCSNAGTAPTPRSDREPRTRRRHKLLSICYASLLGALLHCFPPCLAMRCPEKPRHPPPSLHEFITSLAISTGIISRCQRDLVHEWAFFSRFEGVGSLSRIL